MMRSDCSGEVVAVVFVCYDTGKTGHVDMLSVIPEYMGLGLSSGLLRNSEYLLHEAGEKRDDHEGVPIARFRSSRL